MTTAQEKTYAELRLFDYEFVGTMANGDIHLKKSQYLAESSFCVDELLIQADGKTRAP